MTTLETGRVWDSDCICSGGQTRATAAATVCTKCAVDTWRSATSSENSCKACPAGTGTTAAEASEFITNSAQCVTKAKAAVRAGSTQDVLQVGDHSKVSVGALNAKTQQITITPKKASEAPQSSDPTKARVILSHVNALPPNDYTGDNVRLTFPVPATERAQDVEILHWLDTLTSKEYEQLLTIIDPVIIGQPATVSAIVPRFSPLVLARKLAVTPTPTVTPKPSNFKPLASTVKKGGGKAKNTYLGVMIGALVLLGLVCIVGFVSWRRTVVAARPIDPAFTQMHVNAQPNPNSAHTWLLASSRRSNSNV
jgi:hypothetical protein